MTEPRPNAAKLERDRREFASDLQLMRHRALQLGLYITALRIDPAVRMVAFEIAGDIAACEKYEARQDD